MVIYIVFVELNKQLMGRFVFEFNLNPFISHSSFSVDSLKGPSHDTELKLVVKDTITVGKHV